MVKCPLTSKYPSNVLPKIGSFVDFFCRETWNKYINNIVEIQKKNNVRIVIISLLAQNDQKKIKQNIILALLFYCLKFRTLNWTRSNLIYIIITITTLPIKYRSRVKYAGKKNTVYNFWSCNLSWICVIFVGKVFPFFKSSSQNLSVSIPSNLSQIKVCTVEEDKR